MSEEEKEAIDIVENIKFKQYAIYNAKEMKNEIRFYQTEEERKAIDIVLNLIEKQQKEIEELKKYKQYYENEKVIWKRGSNSISKDKIREKIKEYDKWIEKGEYTESLEAQRYALKELLEE